MVAELPKSIEQIYFGAHRNVGHNPYAHGTTGSHVSDMRRPGTFAFAEFDNSLGADRYPLFFVTITVFLWKYPSVARAQDDWVRYPILKARGNGVSNEELYDARRRELMIPQLSFHVGDGLWEGICVAPRRQKPHLEIATGCSAFAGWASFCNWNLDVEVDVGDNASISEVDDPRVSVVMRDVAGVVMKKVGCKAPSGGV